MSIKAIWVIAVGLFLCLASHESPAQKPVRKIRSKPRVNTVTSPPASTRITPATLTAKTARELLIELEPDFNSGWRQLRIIDGHQSDKSPFALLLESPVHNILRDTGRITVLPGPSGRAIVNFTKQGAADFFPKSKVDWARSELPTSSMVSQGDYRKSVIITIARPYLFEVRNITQTVNDTKETIYWINYLWTYAKTEIGQAIDPLDRQFETTRGFVYRNGRWSEGNVGLPQDYKSSGVEVPSISRRPNDPFVLDCSYASWEKSSLDITRIQSTVLVVPKSNCWTPWLALDRRSAPGHMRFYPDAEIMIETLDHVGATSILPLSRAAFADEGEWYAFRIKNLATKSVTIKFDDGFRR